MTVRIVLGLAALAAFVYFVIGWVGAPVGCDAGCETDRRFAVVAITAAVGAGIGVWKADQ